MRVTTLVTGSFSADHQRPYDTRRHGHDWHVEAEVPDDGHKDEPERRLDAALAHLHGAFLDNLLERPTNEGVAAWIGGQIGAVKVFVYRLTGGRKFGGVWRA